MKEEVGAGLKFGAVVMSDGQSQACKIGEKLFIFGLSSQSKAEIEKWFILMNEDFRC